MYIGKVYEPFSLSFVSMVLPLENSLVQVPQKKSNRFWKDFPSHKTAVKGREIPNLKYLLNT